MTPVRRVLARVPMVHWAVAFSLLLHVVLLSAPSWELPVLDEPVRIEASLLKAPPVRTAAAVPKVSEAKPKQPQRKNDTPLKQQPVARPAVIAQAPTPQADAATVIDPGEPLASVDSAKPAGQETVVGGGDKAVAPSDTPPVSVNPEATQAWPREGRIRFQVRYGEAVEVGEMLHTWSHDGERYTMRSEAATVGLARFIKRFNGVQQSQGRVGPEGLAPNGFQEDLNGKQSHAVFDWTKRSVVMSRPDRVREVGFDGLAQDILSLAHHLAFQPDGRERTSLYIVGGRWGAEATLTQVANERLRLPWGSIETRHFNCVARNGEFIVDLWLSRQHRNAPVRIRVDDRKQGHVVDEIATEIELDGVKADILPSREMIDSYKG